MRTWGRLPRQAQTFAASVGLAGVVLGITLFKLYLLGKYIDHGAYPEERAAVGATGGVLLILAAPTMLLAWRPRLWTLLALNVFLTCLALADIVHFRAYSDVTSIAEILHVGQVSVVLQSIAGLVQPADALFLSDAIVLLLLLFSAPADDSTRARSPRRVMAMGLLAGGLVSMASPARLMWTDPEGVFEYSTTRREVAVAIGLVPYHLHDLFTHVSTVVVGRLSVDRADRREVTRYLTERDGRERSVRSELFGVARNRNLIIVMAESLHEFPIDLVIGGQPVMPALSRFAEESLRFENFYDQTHLGTTSDGEFVSLQSLHPLPAGVVATRYPANHYHALPAILSDEGFATLSASGERGDFWNKRQMHPRLGFDQSVFGEAYELRESFGLGLTDGEFFRQTTPVLIDQREPFMAFLLTQSNHHPYSIPMKHRTMALGQLEGTLLGDYLHSVRYFDSAFDGFLEHLRRTGLLQRSVVVVYGDHRAFWDEIPDLGPLLERAPNSTDLHKAQTQLPLLIRLPDGEHAGVRPGPGGHLDVAPTLLGLLGVEDPSAVMLGRDLLKPQRPTSAVVFRDGGFVDGEYHAVKRSVEPDICVTETNASSIPCASIADRFSAARTQLEVSDLIIRGDLIPELRAERQSLVSARQRFVVIAHRGHSVAAPENTLASIEAAFRAGSDIVEIDVRLSRDGVPVVIHDETVDRTTNGTGAVADLTLAELQQLDAGFGWGDRFVGTRIPTLEQALHTARDQGRLLLDVPVEHAGSAIARALQAVGMSPSDVILGTWSPTQRAEFLRQLPSSEMSLAEGAPHAWSPRYFIEQKRQGVSIFEIANWSPEFIAAAHEHHLPVWAYTINDEATMRVLIESGVSGIETDNPELAVRVARELGIR